MRFWVVLVLILVPLVGSAKEPVEFGDDASTWANDGDCDDRRFFGPGMAAVLNRTDNYHDATDCRRAYRFGQVTLWRQDAAQAATQCSALDFGDDSSEWAQDGECDDTRFEGPGAAASQNNVDLGRDATDCRAACTEERVFLRNYPTSD